MNIHLCDPAFESSLLEELGAGARRVSAGVVMSKDAPAAESDFIFSRHVLLGARWVQASSVRALAKAVIDGLWPALKAQMAFRLDVFTSDAPESSGDGPLETRAALLREVLTDEIRTRRRALFRAMTEDPTTPRLQVLLVERDRALVSFASAGTLPSGDRVPSDFVAGRVVLPAEPDAPSRAYLKLREALCWLGVGPSAGDRVVDLGASPGGWSWVALESGATVIGVDKGDMHERVLSHPGFTHARTDGFKWAPEAGTIPVDWLLCDIIAEPDRSLALLQRWADARWFRNAVFHLKLRSDSPLSLARTALASVRAAGYADVRVKHLLYDKSEVTVLVRGGASPAEGAIVAVSA
ncbi:MAG: hypothetical protein IV100_27355 [Myxococcales bacterium]|nr:hypothetical protein [Myxococcales bacterium]